MISDGHESSSRHASDLASPPAGPAPGARVKTDLDAVRVLLSRLTLEGRSLGIPNSYIRAISDVFATVDAIEKARNT